MSVHAMSSSQASAVKLNGHKRETRFNSRLGFDNVEINWSGSSADCNINESKIPIILRNWLSNKELSLDGGVSMKGGNTIQIHLGNLPELTDKESYQIVSTNPTCVDHGISFEDQKKALLNSDFWNKYLRKGDILCDDDEEVGEYIFFKMDEVISYICDNCDWRLLKTGRLKGDFNGHQYLTYEYRKRKKTFVLGAHGGKKGKEFINLLKQKIDSIKIGY